MSRPVCRKSHGWIVACLSMGVLVLTGMGLGCNEPSHPNQVEIDKIQAQPVGYPFSFIVMGDTRTPGGAPFSQMRSQILTVTPTPRFVIDNGDLVLVGAPTEYPGYVSSIEGYAIPFLSVIGNHEMYFPGGRDSYDAIFGAEDHYFDYANCRFIYMNDAINGSYGVSDQQLTWLEALLAAPTPPDKFVFMHVPPTLPTADRSMSLPEAAANVPGDDQYAPYDGGILSGIDAYPNWTQLTALVEAYGVRIAGFGHAHIFQHTYHANVHYVVSGGGGAETGIVEDNPPSYGVFHHFLVVTIEADGNSRVQLIKKGAGNTPDDRYGFSLLTTPAS